MMGKEVNIKDIDEAKEKTLEALAKLQNVFLETQEFLCGAQPSIADFWLASFFDQL